MIREIFTLAFLSTLASLTQGQAEFGGPVFLQPQEQVREPVISDALQQSKPEIIPVPLILPAPVVPVAAVIVQPEVEKVTTPAQVLPLNCVWRRYGCYEDNPRIMNGLSFERADMGQGVCQAYCALNQYVFAGLKDGFKCFCGNCTNVLGPAPGIEGSCNKPCPAVNAAGLTCGGPGFLELFTCWIPGLYAADPASSRDRCWWAQGK